MRIIVSPAKKMREADLLSPAGVPAFLSEARELLSFLRSLSREELGKLWNCSEKLAAENYERLLSMDLGRNLSPALLSYDGIAYQHMAPSVLEEKALAYCQEHLRILSGLYGVLRPLDGVVPYRLEMGARFPRPLYSALCTDASGVKNLYVFWGEKLYRQVRGEDGVIVNLASEEYARAVRPYLQKDDVFLTCVFGERAGEKVVQKGVYAKAARGEMVRFMAERGVKEGEELKAFSYGGYSFSEERSSPDTLVFVRG